MNFKQWLYRGGHPNLLARILNRAQGMFHALGLFPNYLVTLDVTGRKSGARVSFPLVMAVVDGRRYLVAMLGNEANWVKNVEATGGHALLRHGKTEAVRLVEVDVAERAPILKEYLRIAPGARPHVAIDKHAPLAEFERGAADYPVFRVEAEETVSATRDPGSR